MSSDGAPSNRWWVTLSGGVDRLERVRADPRRRALALGGAVLVGVLAALLHWTGLILAGALAGLVSRSLPRAVATAIGFGILVLVLFALSLGGSAGRVLEMAPAVYLTAGAAIGLPALGALIRGVA